MTRNARSHVVATAILALLSAAPSGWSCNETSATIAAVPTLGGSVSEVNALGSAGQLTGFSYTSGDEVAHEVLYSGGSLTDLGTLGGFLSEGRAINSSGQVAGESYLPDSYDTHATLYTLGSLTDLGTLGGSTSVATALNDAGQVVGYSRSADDSSTEAFLYQNGAMIGLGTLGADYSAAVAINQSGSITGDSLTPDYEDHAFLYANGTMFDLGTLGGDYSYPWGLNDANVVVGESSIPGGYTHAFLYANGAMTDLGTLGGTYSSAYAVNNANQITGVATTPRDAQTHAFLYSSGVMTDLGTLGGTYSEPYAINNLGQVVGLSVTAGDESRAFLYQNGSMADLNTFLPANSGWVLTSARFINDSGRIVGLGIYNGQWQWYVLDLGAGANDPPVAVAGAVPTVDCQSQATLDGSQSSDPNGDPLSFEWSENNIVLGTNATLTISFGLGSHVVTLKVTDPCGESAQTNVTVNVADQSAPTLSCPGALAASTDANCQAAVPDVLSQVSASDNCTAAGSIALTQSPPAGTLVGAGQHTITVTATDPSGNTASCETLFTVADTIAPVIASSPSALTVSAGNDCNGAVPNVLNEIIASDNCTPANQLSVTQSPIAGSPLPVGQHAITVTVTDAAGNSSTQSVALTVRDTTAPNISSVTASPSVLSPPNHQIVPVTVTVVASDSCSAAVVNRIASVTCNEAAAAGDMEVTGDLTLNLAASKNASGSDRVYTITVQSTDASGNSATATATVTVPKSNGNSGKNKP